MAKERSVVFFIVSDTDGDSEAGSEYGLTEFQKSQLEASFGWNKRPKTTVKKALAYLLGLRLIRVNVSYRPFCYYQRLMQRRTGSKTDEHAQILSKNHQTTPIFSGRRPDRAPC